MAKSKIDHAMISGIPLMKKWHEDEPKRLRYYAGEDAGMDWFSATDKNADKPLRQSRDHVSSLSCGGGV